MNRILKLISLSEIRLYIVKIPRKEWDIEIDNWTQAQSVLILVHYGLWESKKFLDYRSAIKGNVLGLFQQFDGTTQGKKCLTTLETKLNHDMLWDLRNYKKTILWNKIKAIKWWAVKKLLQLRLCNIFMVEDFTQSFFMKIYYKISKQCSLLTKPVLQWTS